jgi:hypothetical protein
MFGRRFSGQFSDKNGWRPAVLFFLFSVEMQASGILSSPGLPGFNKNGLRAGPVKKSGADAFRNAFGKIDLIVANVR